jgi:hypothetical protein
MWGILADALSRHLPAQRGALYLTFSLANAERLERMLTMAGFRNVRVERQVREGIVGSFEDYWAPIEAGTALMPQAYLALPEPSRRLVREGVRERLSEFESNGRLTLSVEMLIGAGRA